MVPCRLQAIYLRVVWHHKPVNPTSARGRGGSEEVRFRVLFSKLGTVYGCGSTSYYLEIETTLLQLPCHEKVLSNIILAGIWFQCKTFTATIALINTDTGKEKYVCQVIKRDYAVIDASCTTSLSLLILSVSHSYFLTLRSDQDQHSHLRHRTWMSSRLWPTSKNSWARSRGRLCILRGSLWGWCLGPELSCTSPAGSCMPFTSTAWLWNLFICVVICQQ